MPVSGLRSQASRIKSCHPEAKRELVERVPLTWYGVLRLELTLFAQDDSLHKVDDLLEAIVAEQSASSCVLAHFPPG